MLKKRVIRSVLGTGVFVIFCSCPVMSAVFFDDFSSGYSQWTLEKSGSADFSIENQEAKFTIKKDYAYLKSNDFTLTGWTTIDFNGQWRIVSATTPEYDIFVYDADDENSWLRVTYQSWGGPYLWFRDSQNGTLQKFNRTPPVTMTDFSIHLTQTGWAFSEGTTDWSEQASTALAGATRFRLKIGGWDASSLSNQIVYFDNIVVVPEPTTLCILGLGILSIVRNTDLIALTIDLSQDIEWQLKILLNRSYLSS